MNSCGICSKRVVQLFETGKPGLHACFKCQPLVPEVMLGQQELVESQEEIILNDHDQMELVCPICKKTFVKNEQLQAHLRNHRAERRFVCTYCNKAFSQSNNLRAHLRIHTNERPYKCIVCNKAFTQVTNLNNHMRLHTGERPFVCPEPGCNRAFAQVTNLNQHKKRHVSGRPLESSFDCPVCGEQFEHRNEMYQHRREAHPKFPLKSPTKPVPNKTMHACNICRERFDSAHKLMLHVCTHVDTDSEHRDTITSKNHDVQYKCVFSSCGATLSSPREHTEHLLNAHQLKVLNVNYNGNAPKRGRPPKAKADPLEIKNDYSYDVPIIDSKVVVEAQLEDHKYESQFLPKLKVQSLF